jgi:hypothetical protein
MKKIVALAGLACIALGWLYVSSRDTAPPSEPVRMPHLSQPAGATPMPGMLRGGQVMAVVDLNSASLSQLQTLPGMTNDYAQKILAHRPYSSFADVERAGIPRDVVQGMTPPAIIKSTGVGLPASP